MTRKYQWTPTQRAALTPGATVQLTGITGVRDGRYVVADVDPPVMWLAGGDVGLLLERVDPRTVELPTQRALVAVEL